MLKTIHLPSKMNIDEGDLPSVKDWKVGETYPLTVQAKLLSIRKNDPSLEAQGDKDAGKVHVELVIKGVKEIHKTKLSEPKEDTERRKRIFKKAFEKYK